MNQMFRSQFRILLPVLLLVVSVSLTVVGENRRRAVAESVMHKYGRLEESIPDAVAVERFVNYAISAPAYVASISVPFLFDVKPWKFMRGDRDWWYFAFVLGLWYFVGRLADQRSGRIVQIARIPTWVGMAGIILAIMYGGFMCYTALQLYRKPYDYPYWFEAAIAVWGAVIILFNLWSLLFPRELTRVSLKPSRAD